MNIKRVLIIGGYGNFGRFIAKVLAKNDQIQLIIGGRHPEKAKALIKNLNAVQPAEAIYCDIANHFRATLKNIAPNLVIHTSGPFQGQDYTVALACIEQGCHYIDLADARDFVAGIGALNTMAKEKKVFICSGASSVPCLSSAIVDHYISQFSILETIDYAIATAQLTNQGLATTAGVLSYAGMPFTTLIHGKEQQVYGWQNLRLKQFWHLNQRLLGNCNIPDLALFPQHYPQLKTIRFQAGLELKGLQLILYTLSWMVRLHLLPPLNKFAPTLLKISHFFNVIGHNNTGFYMIMSGLDEAQKPKDIRFEIYAEAGDGLYIPCVPAILLAHRLVNGELTEIGAMPCVGLISLTDYLHTLKSLGLQIRWQNVGLKALIMGGY